MYNYTGRIDQHIGTKDFIFFRYAGYSVDQNAPSTLPTLFTSTQIPSQQYGVSWTAYLQSDHQHAGAIWPDPRRGRHVTQFNNHNLWQTYGCSADMCDSLRGRRRRIGDADRNRRFQRRRGQQPIKNLSSIHEWSGSVMKTIGNHQIQAGGGWDEVNYTAELRQGTVTFSGGIDGEFFRQSQFACRHVQSRSRSPASGWRTSCSTIPTRRTSATFF